MFQQYPSDPKASSNLLSHKSGSPHTIIPPRCSRYPQIFNSISRARDNLGRSENLNAFLRNEIILNLLKSRIISFLE